MPGDGSPEAAALAWAWLGRARDDLAVANMWADERVAPSIAAFHAQQAAEKALKSVLVATQTEFPPTHVIGLLIQLCASSGKRVPDLVLRAVPLTRFAVRTRYPGLGSEITAQEAGSAAVAAEHVVQWAVATLSERSGGAP